VINDILVIFPPSSLLGIYCLFCSVFYSFSSISFTMFTLRWESVVVAVLAVAISASLLRRIVYSRKSPETTASPYKNEPSTKKAPVTFLSLPRELRDQVYAHLVAENGPVLFEPTARGVQKLCDAEKLGPMSRQKLGSIERNETCSGAGAEGAGSDLPVWSLSRLNASLSRIFSARPRQPGGAGLLLANRKLHDEYASIMCRDAKLCFRISDQDEEGPEEHLWPSLTLDYLDGEGGNRQQMQDSMRSRIRQLDVTIELRPAPGPTHGGRETPPPLQQTYEKSSVFRRSVEFISQFTGLWELHIHIVVCGNVIVNPIVQWQAFAMLYQPLFAGPRTTLSFALADWNVKGNLLTRPAMEKKKKNGQGRGRIEDEKENMPAIPTPPVVRRPGMISPPPGWVWSCENGHPISADIPHHRPVLYFYSSLYRECQRC